MVTADLVIPPPTQIQRGESIEDAVMRVFARRQSMWLSSSFFVRRMGLQRWTAQKVLAALAARTLRTSPTRLVAPTANLFYAAGHDRRRTVDPV